MSDQDEGVAVNANREEPDLVARVKFLEGAVMVLSKRFEQAVRIIERKTGVDCELEWKELRGFPDGLRYQSTLPDGE